MTQALTKSALIINDKLALKLSCGLLSALIFSSPLYAQNARELQNLIFEPVLISFEAVPAPTDTEFETANSVEVNPPQFNVDNFKEDEDSPQFLVKEVTRLPQGDNVNLRTYLNVQAVEEQDARSSEISIEETVSQYEQSVIDLELIGGPYEPRLAQELLALGSSYHEQGEFQLALETFDRATHVNRVNNGLFNDGQLPILQKKIQTNMAQGDLLAADENQEQMFYLERKNHGSFSTDLLPALTRYAEWNMFAFNVRLGSNPTDTFGAESDAFTSASVNNSIGSENFLTRRLVNAQNIYRSIIQILLSNYGFSDRRILDMEKRLALTNYFFATSYSLTSGSSGNSTYAQAGFGNSVSGNSMGYRHGKEALERRIEYLERMDDTPPEEMTSAMIELADWHLIFKKRMSALEIYDDIYQNMIDREVSLDIINETFYPAYPETAPNFIAYRYTRAANNIPEDLALEYKGFIDLEFTINRFGSASSLSVLDQTWNTTDPILSRLIRNVRRAQFRPRYRDGEALKSDFIQARYYYTY